MPPVGTNRIMASQVVYAARRRVRARVSRFPCPELRGVAPSDDRQGSYTYSGVFDRCKHAQREI